MSMDEPLFAFKAENGVSDSAPCVQDCWTILSVEDDPEYQASLELALDGQLVLGRPLNVLTAASAQEAALLIAEHPDISVILLDVVMEDDHAGLRLVGTIREVQGNASVRIVLLTGQPGMAPRREVMDRYDIDDYWCKSDLSSDQLLTITTANIRTWDHLAQLNRTRHGLQMLIEAGQALSSKRDLVGFTQSILTEIGRLIGADSGGIVCSLHRAHTGIDESEIIAAIGPFEDFTGGTLADLPPGDLTGIFDEASRNRQQVVRNGYTVLHFDCDDLDGREYLTLVSSTRPLSDAEINLLQVFSVNIRSGFTNVALYNRLSELAYHDPLLGVPNRNWLLRELGNLNARERGTTSLVLIDIDDFIDIGVTFGDRYCNELLGSFHQRLVDSLSPNELIARIDRDCFAILASSSERIDAGFCERILSQPLPLGGAGHRVEATVVLTPLASLSGLEPEKILRLAESSVEAAHRQHRHFMVYDPEREQQISERYALLNDLRDALAHEQLFIELQPKVRLADGGLVGFEALARWEHPSGMRIPPDSFIVLAEASGLIGRLDQLILRQVCLAVRQLQMNGIDVPIAFNASSTELLYPEFFESTLALIQGEGVALDRLELEVTETQAMDDYAQIAPNLRRLIDRGMKVSIDDFGTGYSSLAHITELAATTLKIDRTFVSRLEQSVANEQVVEMILRLGERFGFEIIAEGIETESQRQLMLAKGCRLGQGYLFAAPMSLSSAIEWARDREPD